MKNTNNLPADIGKLMRVVQVKARRLSEENLKGGDRVDKLDKAAVSLFTKPEPMKQQYK